MNTSKNHKYILKHRHKFLWQFHALMTTYACHQMILLVALLSLIFNDMPQKCYNCYYYKMTYFL